MTVLGLLGVSQVLTLVIVLLQMNSLSQLRRDVDALRQRLDGEEND